MTTIGPINLNGGYVSDADFWSPTQNGGCMYYDSFVPYEHGAKTIDSVSSLTATPNAGLMQGFCYWQDPAQLGTANRDIVIAISNAKCYTSPFNSISWTDETNAKTIPSTGYATFDFLNAKALIAINGGNTTGYGPFKISTYNGALNTLGGSPPTGGYVKVVNNFAFLSGNLTSASVLSRVYWSNVGDPETWTSANFVDVNLNDGEPVTALSAIGNSLIIFKLNSIWSLSTTTTATSGVVTLGPLTCLSTKYGCVGPLAVDAMPDGTLAFVSSDAHTYRTDGVTFVDLSHNPSPASNIIQEISPVNTVVPAPTYGPLFNSFLKVDAYNSRIWLSMSSSAGGLRFYAFDYLRKAWSILNAYRGQTNQLGYMQTMPSATGVYGPIDKRFYMGDIAGIIHSFSPWYTAGFNNTFPAGNNGLAGHLAISINLGSASPPGFIPRSLTIPVWLPGLTANPVGTLGVTIGFDGIGNSASYSSTFSSAGLQAVGYKGFALSADLAGRILLNIPLPSGPRKPITMQVAIAIAGDVTNGLTNCVIEPFYISDEVLT